MSDLLGPGVVPLSCRSDNLKVGLARRARSHAGKGTVRCREL
ncbi:hypothetical protein V3C99_001654, partial [Haemonchus contortus]